MPLTTDDKSLEENVDGSRSGEPSPGIFTSLAPKDEPVDEAKAALERELQAEKEGRLEERFIWIVVCVILIDVMWFRNSQNAIIPVIVMLLEAIILFIIAKRMGIQEVKALFEQIIQSLSSRSGGRSAE